MSRFVDYAHEILEAAESAGSPSDVTILLGSNGIRLIADSDWPLDSLLRHHGADAAYRVSGNHGSVRVEGRDLSHRCMIESRTPAETARLMLAARTG